MLSILSLTEINDSKAILVMCECSQKIQEALKSLISVSEKINKLKGKDLSIQEEKDFYSMKREKLELRKVLSIEMDKYFHDPLEWFSKNSLNDSEEIQSENLMPFSVEIFTKMYESVAA